MIAKYRKKPVVIQAVQLLDSTIQEVQDFVGEHTTYPYCKVGGIDPTDGKYKIKTPEGVMTATIGDYIIRGIKGEYYPCKPDIFEATYERVD